MRRFGAFVLCVAAVVAGLVVSAPAGAQVGPHVSLVPIHAKITAGTKPQFTYISSNLPSGSVQHVQRQFGSQHVWKNLTQVQGTNGTVTTASLAMGKYNFRIHVTRNGALVVNSNIAIIYAYGNISLGAFCGGMDSSDCETGTEQVGGTVLSYRMYMCTDYYPSYCQAAHSAGTSCRSVTFRYASRWAPDTDTAYLEVVQGRSDPQYDSVGPNTVGVFKAHLDGSALYIDAATTNDNNIAATGSASCYTLNGRK
jgi:hypothetical protein